MMPSAPFKTLAFDLDGTIADTSPDLAHALNAALASLGRRPVDLGTVRSLIGHGTRAMLRKGLAVTGGCDETLVDAGYPVLMRHYEEHICDLTRPYPGVETAFDVLAGQGVALALCTNKPSALTRRLIEALGWSNRFAAVIAGDTLAVCKPDPAPLHLAIQRAGGAPAAFVGDSSVDIATARAAGVPSIAVSFGFADAPPHAMGADRVIDSYSELFGALASLALNPDQRLARTA